MIDGSKTSIETMIHVVENDEGMRHSLRMMLSGLEAQVKTFQSAEDFLTEPLSQIPDCLIAEMDLPGMNGLELLERLQTRGLKIPMILLAGPSEVPLAVRAIRAGALDFIEKPFVEKLLLDVVRQAIEPRTVS